VALHHVFESTVDARGDAAAVIDGDTTISYRALDALANRVARALRARGVERGATVALTMPRSIDAYAAMLGILKAGAAYVPVDPAYPLDRIRFLLSNSGARAMVTTADLARSMPQFDRVVLRMDADRRVIDAESAAPLPNTSVRVGGDDLCCIIYTSGSAGRPNGVMIEHRNVCHLVRAEADLFFIRPEDRVYQGSSLSFDASVEEIWLAFHAGATLVAPAPELSREDPNLRATLAACGVTVLSCAPALLDSMTGDIPTLRLILLCGGSCPPPLVDRWARHGRRIVNTYGFPETTAIATWAELRRGSPVTLGRALYGCRVFLLDDQRAKVAHGDVGEICIGGAGLARGYLNLPRETDERFVTLRAGASGSLRPRVFRTGEFGRFNAKGELELRARS
jgi:amino acid adenylation domain-containing protein